MGTRRKEPWIDRLFNVSRAGLTPQYVDRNKVELTSPGVEVSILASVIERNLFKRMLCRVEFSGTPEAFGYSFSLRDAEAYSEEPATCRQVEPIEALLADRLRLLVGEQGESHPYYVGTDLDTHRGHLRLFYTLGRDLD